MTTKAVIKLADLKRMAEVAKQGGVRVEVEKNGVIYRVAPDNPNATATPAKQEYDFNL